ncbi:MAG: valine--pyruvate transaminase [Planctomycetes bacterium]|nr:valine--pyruvate transaminase [Planctomycetota bacterium]
MPQLPTQLSLFGQKLCRESGISELMKDLNSGLQNNSGALMLGGGNPARIPAMEQLYREAMLDLLERKDDFEQALGVYDSPQGNDEFIESLVDFFNQEHQLGISKENIAISNGSQSAFFHLFNMLGGQYEKGEFGNILLPLVPEYIGYADIGIHPEMLISQRPLIKECGDHGFKYHVDFQSLKIGKQVKALCVSRPTNPSGNVIGDHDIKELAKLAKEKGIYLIIDNAYGLPFPNILFQDSHLFWDENIILSFSLSKVGLPTTRTGIIIARSDIITSFSKANAITSLASGRVGQAMTHQLISSRELPKMSQQVIKPFYEQKAKQARAWFKELMDENIEYRLHETEGAMFLWVWFKDLPISCQELYEKLKAESLLVVPGHYFFIAQEKSWQHSQECLRIHYAQDDEKVKKGLEILARVVREEYTKSSRS